MEIKTYEQLGKHSSGRLFYDHDALLELAANDLAFYNEGRADVVSGLETPQALGYTAFHSNLEQHIANRATK